MTTKDNQAAEDATRHEPDRIQQTDSVVVWAQRNLVLAVILCAVTAGTTYGILRVTVIGPLEKAIEASKDRSAKGEAIDAGLRAALSRLEQTDISLWRAIQQMQVEIKKATPATTIHIDSPTTRIHLGQEYDKCGGSTITVHAADGSRVPVGRGETKTIRVALNGDGWFYWDCDGDKERTRPTWRDTNLIICSRDAAGRGISWSCYREN
jgi:hypothetical protein